MKQPATDHTFAGDIESFKNNTLGLMPHWRMFSHHPLGKGCVQSISNIKKSIFNDADEKHNIHKQLFNTCENNFKMTMGIESPLVIGLADIYYIPREMIIGTQSRDSIGEAANLAKLFFDNKYYNL